jgi:Ca2+-binding EF-hand superfamily protein
MRQPALILGVLACAGLSVWADEPAKPTAPVLQFPGTAEPSRIRLEVKVVGKSPEQAWEAFLERFFDYFDRDGDGSLSKVEIGRMFPLPLTGGNELKFDFAKLDSDGDGKVSRSELKSYCRQEGFGQVVVTLEPPSADDLRLAELFGRHLSLAGPQKSVEKPLLSPQEFIRKFDLDDDEYVDAAELMAAATPAPPPRKSVLSLVRTNEDVVLSVDLGARREPARLEGRTERFRLETVDAAVARYRLRGSQGRWLLSLRTTLASPDVESAGDFLVAQFRTALGDRKALTREDLESDPALHGFIELFAYADRNGDGQLTLVELEDYLKLIAMGVRSQVWIRVMDHDRNPFHILDAEGNGKLGYRELLSAANLLQVDEPESARLPWQFQIVFGGPSTRLLGGVSIPTSSKRAAVAGGDKRPVPRWFQAMDRNGDGVISPREFVGPPELFRKLVSDGEGVITPENAQRAEKRTP